MMVTVPLLVEVESGVNDLLDRDGLRTPISFHISNDRERHPVDAQIVPAATKWKRMALRQFSMGVGHGPTDARQAARDPGAAGASGHLHHRLADGYPHENRAADYDDWVTETRSQDGRPMHGLTAISCCGTRSPGGAMS